MDSAFQKGHVGPKSVIAADIVTVGDSWLPLAIKKGTIEPIYDAEGQNWFNCLDDKWKVRRLCPVYLKMFAYYTFMHVYWKVRTFGIWCNA